MENKADLSKKYLSVYLTLNKWCSMAINSGEWKRKPINKAGEAQKPAMTKEQADKEYEAFAKKNPKAAEKMKRLQHNIDE